MSGHTPGPWMVTHELRQYDEAVADLVNSTWVIPADGQRLGHWSDDARLIAAAPELLAIAQRWAAIDGGAWMVERHARERAELLAETVAAIAKATQP